MKQSGPSPSRFALFVALTLTTVLAAPETNAMDSTDKPPAEVVGNNANGPLLPRDSRDAAIFRGGLVYANYCVTCHGINADGNGRAARLHNPRPANLRLSDKNDVYIAMIVRKGGEAMGRSPDMPPWGEELTDEQIRDIVAFVRGVNVHQ